MNIGDVIVVEKRKGKEKGIKEERGICFGQGKDRTGYKNSFAGFGGFGTFRPLWMDC